MAKYVVLLAVALSALASAATFESQVQPIFQAKCLSCHNEKAALGKLDLHSPDAVLKGGASGPAVMPGDASKSLLIDKVVTRQMPPGKATKLTDSEIDQIRNWIDKELTAPKQVVAEVKEQDARAVFQARCIACHGSLKQSGGLDLRTTASRLKGGKSGPGLVPGKPEESLIYKRIANGQMPPEREAKQLAVELPTDQEKEVIRGWIAAGAREAEPLPVPADAAIKPSDRKFWSFQPPVRPAVPATPNAKNPIDAFLLAKLQSKGLGYSKPATQLQLLRRVYLDLTGMVPTKAEIDAYLADKAPGAYERVVDKLLASDKYGERWAQHWLDLAGYSDSEGFGQDDGVRPYAWRFRDYVIRSMNADKPYDKFLTEQLAGDEMSNDWKTAKGTANQQTIDRLAATGFLRATPDPTDSNERGLIAERMNILADETEVLASSVMGLTVGCARCHNHKYDPIPQRDYYRLSAILQAAYNPYEWKTPKSRQIDLATEEERKLTDAANAPIEAEIAKITSETEKLLAQLRNQVLDESKDLTPELRAEILKIADIKPVKRTAEQVVLAQKFKAALVPAELIKKFPDAKPKFEALQKDLQEKRSKLTPKPHIRVLMDNEQPSTAYLLRRGDSVGFGYPVEPGVPAVLENAALKPYQVEAPFAGTSGRRLALAKWMTQPNHPLTSRVLVNQLWMRHFGRGIVASVSNFGRSGTAPSHPELLDWLATEFTANNWSMKAMHRLMVTSDAYRQSSEVNDKLLAADPDNVLLSRMPLRRMDAETLYDSLITAASRLDSKLYGKPSDLDISADKEVSVKPDEGGFRRSIYVLHRRQTPVSLMDAFDQPTMTPNCTERRRSNVATQALHMMNGSMSWNLSKYMAGRVIDEAGSDRKKQIESIYYRAYSRPPSSAEVDTALTAIDSLRREWPSRLDAEHMEAPRTASAEWLALASYCHAILNSAEFSFID